MEKVTKWRQLFSGKKEKMMDGFLPVTREEMTDRGWQQCDFVYICGDAYVDHPSFGMAIITRLLEAHGYKVGVIAQPDWKDEKSIQVFGEPRLAFLVSAGNMDSMVNHYTVARKRRKSDAYTPGGIIGKRPDYAVAVYGNLIRRVYKHTPILIGGIEASLRRMGHYDYWSDKVKRSVLLDSAADILMYGMGEHSMLELAEALDAGIDVSDITYVRGTVYKTNRNNVPSETVFLPEFERIKQDKKAYAESFKIQYGNTDPFTASAMAEEYPHGVCVVQNPPAYPVTTMEMDDIYSYKYTYTYHPSYEKDGGVSAVNEVKFSITSNRGCFGGCNFCALTFHQGRIVQARSHESILEEAKRMTDFPDFKGYIHDVGGPTANFRAPSCKKQLTKGVCADRQCLFPRPCRNLKADHKDYVELLRKIRKLPKVKKVFVRSGIRYDYVLADKDNTFMNELVRYHISGQLRVAPEHVSPDVLKLMGKPSNDIYNEFCKRYERINTKIHAEQYVVPYLMSSHPGSTIKDAIMLAEYIRDLGYMPEQVQDFYPTPSTVSTCMYYTGINPLTMEKVYVPVNPHEKAMQRALIQYKRPENYELVKEALLREGRSDLIGFGSKCLIPPRKIERNKTRNYKKTSRKKHI